MTIQQIAETLTAKYRWNICTFGLAKGSNEWAFRYLVKAVLVSGSSDDASEAAILSIGKAFPSIHDLAGAKYEVLAELIEQAGVRFHPRKARQIIQIARRVAELPAVPNNRKDLEALDGVGRHVASVILATVYGQNEFAVDLHVRRIFERLGLIPEKYAEIAIERLVQNAVEPSLLGHFSRALVDFGQSVCGFVPQCAGCPLAAMCPTAKGTASSPTRATKGPVAGFDGVFTVPSTSGDKDYTVRVQNGTSTCSCIANRRYHKICSHITSVMKK